MKITAISDLHGFLPKLDGGDLLIVAGDLTSRDTTIEHGKFFLWLENQNYKKIVYIAGNHDNFYQEKDRHFSSNKKLCYLQDSGTEFEGVKIWGSPWTKWFHGINPRCKAFTKRSETELAKKWDLIPIDTEILITHMPPYGILDKIIDGDHVGSKSLQMEAFRLKNLKLWIFGHIHECYGEEPTGGNYSCRIINASIVNEYYDAVNKPVSVEL